MGEPGSLQLQNNRTQEKEFVQLNLVRCFRSWRYIKEENCKDPFSRILWEEYTKTVNKTRDCVEIPQ